MSKQIVTILAAAFAAAAHVLTNAVLEGEDSTATPETSTGGDDKPRRGRPPGSTNKPAATEPEKPSSTGGKTYEELQKIIEPMVKDGRAAEVKAVIQKYGADLKTLATLPQHHKAFEADIDGLSL